MRSHERKGVGVVTVQFSGGLLLALLLLLVLVALPVKLAAHFAGAARTGLLWCTGAVAVGLVTGYLASLVGGGLIGGPLAGFLGFVLGIRLMLGTSYVSALGLSVIAFGLSLLGLALLAKLGLGVGTTGPEPAQSVAGLVALGLCYGRCPGGAQH
jgi:hypothetical protein